MRDIASPDQCRGAGGPGACAPKVRITIVIDIKNIDDDQSDNQYR